MPWESTFTLKSTQGIAMKTTSAKDFVEFARLCPCSVYTSCVLILSLFLNFAVTGGLWHITRWRDTWNGIATALKCVGQRVKVSMHWVKPLLGILTSHTGGLIHLLVHWHPKFFLLLIQSYLFLFKFSPSFRTAPSHGGAYP